VASGDNATQANAAGNVLSQTPTYTPYISGGTDTALSPSAITSVGGNQPHDNMQPYLGINFIISLFGIFPSQT